MDTFDAALIKLFLDFVKDSEGVTSSISPIETAAANSKNYFAQVSKIIPFENQNRRKPYSCDRLARFMA